MVPPFGDQTDRRRPFKPPIAQQLFHINISIRRPTMSTAQSADGFRRAARRCRRFLQGSHE